MALPFDLSHEDAINPLKFQEHMRLRRLYTNMDKFEIILVVSNASLNVDPQCFKNIYPKYVSYIK